MNNVYKIKLLTDDNGLINNVNQQKLGIYLGDVTNYSWSRPMSKFDNVKLNLIDAPELVQIKDKKLYRYPKLCLPRMKVDVLKEKYNVKVVRDKTKSDYSIISMKYLDSITAVPWDIYYDISVLKDLIDYFTSVQQQYPDTVSIDFADKLNMLYRTLHTTDRIHIDMPYYYGNNNSNNFDLVRDAANKIVRGTDDHRNIVYVKEENEQDFNSLMSGSQLVLDKVINSICSEDMHVMTADEVDQVQTMIQSDDRANRALALEMMSNCNLEACLDKVATAFYFNYNYLKDANNWNHVNVKALRERLGGFTNDHGNTTQIYMYQNLIRLLVGETSFTEWAWLEIRKRIYNNVYLGNNLTGSAKRGDETVDNLFTINIEDIKLNEELQKALIVEPDGNEIIEELTSLDGFDDLPF